MPLPTTTTFFMHEPYARVVPDAVVLRKRFGKQHLRSRSPTPRRPKLLPTGWIRAPADRNVGAANGGSWVAERGGGSPEGVLKGSQGRRGPLLRAPLSAANVGCPLEGQRSVEAR